MPVKEGVSAVVGGMVTYRSKTIAVVGASINPSAATPYNITL
jgi:predicted CoA-binding protein